MLVRYMRSSVAFCSFPSSSLLTESITTKASTKKKTRKKAQPPMPIKASEHEINHYDSLAKRVFSVGFRRRNPLDAIRKWKEEGHAVSKYELAPIIRELRWHKLFDQALLTCEWMTEQKDIEVSEGDYAIRLELIARCRGVIMAEYFFAVMPREMRGVFAFTALLHIYLQNGELIKAERMMKKMKETGLLTIAAPFNHMVTAYLSIRRIDKAKITIKKLKEHTTPDTITYNLMLRICCCNNNLKGAEKLVAEMNERNVRANWRTFCTLAWLYIENKQFQEAAHALKDMEERASIGHRYRPSFIQLMTLHASMGGEREVSRIWRKMQLDLPKLNDAEYNAYMVALVRLGLFERATQLFSMITSPDQRRLTPKRYFFRKGCELGGILLAGYINTKDMESAERFFNFLKTRIVPSYEILVHLAWGYLKNRETMKGVGFFLSAMSLVTMWYPDRELDELIREVFRSLEGDGDARGAEVVLEALRNVGYVNTGIYNWVLKTYVKAGKLALGIAERMTMDKVEMDGETRILMELSNNVR